MEGNRLGVQRDAHSRKPDDRIRSLWQAVRRLRKRLTSLILDRSTIVTHTPKSSSREGAKPQSRFNSLWLIRQSREVGDLRQLHIEAVLNTPSNS